MRPNIYFKTPKSAGTSVLQTLDMLGVREQGAKYHKIGTNGFVAARFNMAADDYSKPQEWEGEFEQNAFLWTVVRNPYARTVSAWRHMQTVGAFRKDLSFQQWLRYLYYDWYGPLETDEELARAFAVMRGLCECDQDSSELKGKRDRPYMPNCDCYFNVNSHSSAWDDSFLFHRIPTTHVTTPRGEWTMKRMCKPRKLDHVIRFENLQEGFDELCFHLHLPQTELPRIFPHTAEGNPVRPDGGNSSTDYTQFYEGDVDIELASFLYRYEIETYGYEFGK